MIKNYLTNMDDEQIVQNLLNEYNLIDDVAENESEPAENSNINFLGVVFMTFIWIEGLRTGSKLIWIPDQECLYYVNGKHKNGTACTCIVNGCDARISLRADGTAKTDSSHKLHASSLYPMYKERDLFKWMKDRCRSAPASATIRDIYEEAVRL